MGTAVFVLHLTLLLSVRLIVIDLHQRSLVLAWIEAKRPVKTWGCGYVYLCHFSVPHLAGALFYVLV